MLKQKIFNKEEKQHSYKKQIERNIGYISLQEQEIIRESNIAVLGVGGLGGSLVEQLVRAGCENLLIADNDIFEISNLNRQLCNQFDLGQYKIDVLAKKMMNINQNVKISKIYHFQKDNIRKLLKDISVVALTLDDPIISILIARICFAEKIPMLETWAIPYLCAWWFTHESLSYERCYELNSEHLEIEEILNSESIRLDIRKTLIPKVMQFPGLKERIDRESGSLDRMLSGKIGLRSFAPIVRMSASYLAFEVIFSGLLHIKPMILAPNVIGYDYFRMRPLKFQL